MRELIVHPFGRASPRDSIRLRAASQPAAHGHAPGAPHGVNAEKNCSGRAPWVFFFESAGIQERVREQGTGKGEKIYRWILESFAQAFPS